MTARLCEEHDIAYADIDRIEAVVNWFETEYPSPAFPTPGSDGKPRVGSTQYFTAYGAATRGYPLLRGAQPGPGETDPPEVLDLMHRVTLIPMVRRTLFGPRITVFTKDGRSYTREGTGREFIWDFEEHAQPHPARCPRSRHLCRRSSANWLMHAGTWNASMRQDAR